MENRPSNIRRSNTANDKTLRIIAFFLLLISVLLLLIFLKLEKISKNFVIAANNESIEISTNNEEYNDIIDVFFETTEDMGDILPLYDETSDSTTTISAESSEIIESKTNVATTTASNPSAKTTYVINKNSKKMHYKTCSFVSRMKDENKVIVQLDKQELNSYLNSGYSFCSSCGG